MGGWVPAHGFEGPSVPLFSPEVALEPQCTVFFFFFFFLSFLFFFFLIFFKLVA